MAILCPEYDLLYIRVPATGSSVVAQTLQEELGGQTVPEQPVRRDGHTIVSDPHCTVPSLIEGDVLSQEYIDSCLVVANVRNPFDRWPTYYQRRVGGDWVEYSAGTQRRRLDREREALDISEEEYERRRRSIKDWEQAQKRKGRKMRRVGFNGWMTYTLLRWWRDSVLDPDRPLIEYAFPMLTGVDVAIRQERLGDGLNRVLDLADTGIRIDLPEKNATSGKKPYTEYYAWPTRRLATWMFTEELEALGYTFEGLQKTASPLVELRTDEQGPNDRSPDSPSRRTPHLHQSH